MAQGESHALITGSSRGIGRGIGSDKARWITGQVIYVDGGASLMNPEVPTEIQIG
jgi:NAD(P)-dependent dehydrogenase (short-subunit alcohol dehydrogenase family)